MPAYLFPMQSSWLVGAQGEPPEKKLQIVFPWPKQKVLKYLAEKILGDESRWEGMEAELLHWTWDPYQRVFDKDS